MAVTDPDPTNPPAWNLNALAKGLIVDRAVAAAAAVASVTDVLVNAGGDLRHHGAEALVVDIEDPARPYDNAEPLTRVALADGALATSGGTRRGWTIDGRWYSHVLDPRSGRPVDHVSSASVLAPDAATADVVATICAVLVPTEAVAFVEALAEPVACLLVEPGGARHRSVRWPEESRAEDERAEDGSGGG